MTIRRKFTAFILILVIIMTSFCWNIETADAAVEWYWPFDGYTSQAAAFGKISSSYGYRGKGYNRVHYGVDIAEPRGKNVYAVRSGRVITVHNSTSGTAGRYIVIDHLDGYYSTYMHLSAVYVSSGANVTQNTAIGAVGGSANGSETAYGAHLHLRISYGAANNESSINPCPPGYTRVGASFNDGVGYPMGQATISYKISRSATPVACTHTYVTESETAHPHKEYKRCTKCGYTYYTGVDFAGKISSCQECQLANRKYSVLAENNTGNVVYSVRFGEMIELEDDIQEASEGFEFLGWNLYRDVDKKWLTVQAKWQTAESISQKGYQKHVYPPNYSMMFHQGWLAGAESATSFTFVPVWGNKKIYKISYNGNGGTVPDIGENVVFEDTLRTKTAQRSGYKLKGWNLYRVGDQKWYSDGSGWQTQSELTTSGVKKRLYAAEQSLKLDRYWLYGLDNEPQEFIFYAVWEEDVQIPAEPEKPEECRHLYEKRYYLEAHPHQAYDLCSLCGNRKYIDEYAEFADCEKCNPKIENSCWFKDFSLTSDNNQVLLNWDFEGNADEICIYKEKEKETATKIGSVSSGNSYTDSDLDKGIWYSYYLVALKNGKKVAETGTIMYRLGAPEKNSKIESCIKNTKITSLTAKKSAGKAVLIWKKAKTKYKVDGFYVYRAIKKNGKYTKIASTGKTTYRTSFKLVKGKTYYFKVRGYRVVDGKTVYTKDRIIKMRG